MPFDVLTQQDFSIGARHRFLFTLACDYQLANGPPFHSPCTLLHGWGKAVKGAPFLLTSISSIVLTFLWAWKHGMLAYYGYMILHKVPQSLQPHLTVLLSLNFHVEGPGTRLFSMLK